MTKKRTSISVDGDVFEFLQQPEINQSGLINDLVSEYKSNERRQVAALELRYKHLMQEHEEHAEKAERKKQQAEEVKDLLDDARKGESEKMTEARDALTGVPLEPDNPAIENWSEKLGMEPEELIQRLE